MHHVSLPATAMRALLGSSCACWAASGFSLQRQVCVSAAASKKISYSLVAPCRSHTVEVLRFAVDLMRYVSLQVSMLYSLMAPCRSHTGSHTWQPGAPHPACLQQTVEIPGPLQG